MTLIEKIMNEIDICDDNIAKCEMSMKITETELNCLKSRREILNDLLVEAQNENTDVPVPEQKQAKPARKKKPASESVIDTIKTPDKPAPSAQATISMKSLSEELNVSTSAIAQVCNQLGYNDEMITNNYHLTPEQATGIRNAFSAKSESN